MTPPPDLPYAPKRTRPLSLWNPLDYLTLLYWVFYFPQAIRWYAETFGSTKWDEDGLRAVWEDRARRNLTLQYWVLIIVGLVLCFLLFPFVYGVGVVLFLIFVIVTEIVVPVSLMAGGVILGGILGAFGGSLFGPIGVFGGMLVGAVVGGVIGFVSGPVVLKVMGKVSKLAVIFVGLRPDAWLLGMFFLLLRRSKGGLLPVSHISPLPQPTLESALKVSLRRDWSLGIQECEGLLHYSLQFKPVNSAIHQVLSEFTNSSRLLPLVTQWASMNPHNWDVVRYQSASLDAMYQEKFWKLLTLPTGLLPDPNNALRFDTPPRAACAAFWLLNEKKPADAADAFHYVDNLPYGKELYANARAMGEGVKADTLDALAKWQVPSDPPTEVLRPTVRDALLIFGRVAQDAGRVLNSRSIHQRNVALSRATGTLTDMLKRLEEFPTPERDNLEIIARQWRDILLSHATEVGTLEVREPVTSPYIVGAIVPAARLVGRADIFSQLQAAWAKPGPRESLVIYGHRRMGKSSIARALLHFCNLGDETGLAVLNLQAVDWSGGVAYLAHAIAFELWRARPTSLPEPSPDDFTAHPIPTLQSWLARLHATHPERRYLLILDEYELLEEKLPPDAARAFSTLLRGLTQQEPWLAVALVGLHTLQERSADIYHEMFAWRTLRVGLMDADAVADTLQVEDDDFPLEYDLDAIARAHHLTGGQPFLVQLLGDSLVQRFNRQLRHDLTPPPPRLTAADVDAVTSDAMFFEQGDAYFRGIWAQAGEAPAGQHALLRALAPHPDGLSEAAWQAATGLDAATFAQAQDALARHDVIACTGGTCRYTVELLRRWVETGLKVEG